MEFQEIQQRALAIRKQYETWEKEQYGRSWTPEEIAMGFVGDVGDLLKLLLAHEGVRHIPQKEVKLAHEFADCLWSLLVLSQKYNIDLEQAFLQAMETLEEHLNSKRKAW